MSSTKKIAAVDLFCGAGGLTHGLIKAGIDVRVGIDLDPACHYPIEKNNNTRFIKADVSQLTPLEILSIFKNSEINLMAGCAPCQPFSSYSRSTKQHKAHKDWGLLSSFSDLAIKVKPTLVTMENVPPLRNQEIFKNFVSQLIAHGYFVDFKVVKCTKIGLPQSRQRLVLVASSLGPITLPDTYISAKTVRETISDLPAISAGSSHSQDPLHAAASLSELNLARIRHSKPGGTWRDWPEELRAPCHVRDSGSTYPSVYGRMEWDEPAPTITTQCYGFGNGRFGHPEQDRAISLREAAMLQSFPKEYSFSPAGTRINFNNLGRLIGNAVPVVLGEYIGKTLVEHVRTA
ncbi:DNA cytosine methyltransferase [Halomonas aquamarina]|jgi:DNA (cytosine-5)-methyltransferase 1|uniref:DNA (cytosine-5-)-methyltransferase n=1 Tax=Vreelandella aquamarina TaxID=77097 RepID=A0A1H8EUQ2_9GAMM|nr:DNA cytosine methyltransferase [Halomonas aquamarina]MDC8442554.1 DNA cytosine methyltransferase [Halomonas aquamarina]SEN23106.1 DNA (cytosine-5)-methyltransferase 1 [Halomonas aquamarina]HBN58694.1 DNA cytosine methyltransferase [Halomonas sp.]|tara:strand:- start:1090 stop:2130 length:1041 start_codon:yes stop_codon:yes gene_type:complete